MKKRLVHQLDISANEALAMIYVNITDDPLRSEIDVFSNETLKMLAMPTEANVEKLMKLKVEGGNSDFYGYLEGNHYEINYFPKDQSKRSGFPLHLSGIAKDNDEGALLVSEFRLDGFLQYMNRGIIGVCLLLLGSIIYDGEYLIASILGAFGFGLIWFLHYTTNVWSKLAKRNLPFFCVMYSKNIS